MTGSAFILLAFHALCNDILYGESFEQPASREQENDRIHMEKGPVKLALPTEISRQAGCMKHMEKTITMAK